MMKKIKFTNILIVLTLSVLALAGYYFGFPQDEKQNMATQLARDEGFGWKFPVARFPLTGINPGPFAYSDIRDPGGTPQGLPVRLKIPAIGVDTRIEDALITPDGRMDVPAGSKNVAWFALGPPPGKEGSAVIGGHFGIKNNVPFVFYDLDKLVRGDMIYIIDDKDDTHTFVVREIKLFDRDADATTVFTSNDGLAHLNLITCEGIWNQVNDTYPDRRVVFTDEMSQVSASGVSSISFYRSLALGSQGADVETLQRILEKKGLLVMPTGVSRGYFGALTSTAVAKYQTARGLPSIGIFGPMTRANLISELGMETLLPTAGTEDNIAESATEKVGGLPRGTNLLTEYFHTQFSAPVDAGITFMLLILVVGMLYKIIHKKNMYGKK